MTRDELKAKATELEIEFPPNIPTAKLEELVASKWDIPTGNAPADDKKEDVKPKSVKAEVVNDYYEGHPRRIIKLKGLKSRTHDADERFKIERMIKELERG